MDLPTALNMIVADTCVQREGEPPPPTPPPLLDIVKVVVVLIDH